MYSPRQVSLIAGAAPALLTLGASIHDYIAYANSSDTVESLSHWHVLILWVVMFVTSFIFGIFVAASVRFGLFTSKCRGLSPRSAFLIAAIITAIVAVFTFTPINAQSIVVAVAPSLLDDPRLFALAIRYGVSAALQLVTFGLVAHAVARFTRARASVA